ncbi:hypothetical protein [Arthrobacter sp. PAMC25284]|uniref:hypothetical protein n=1 Tax=Arthrobacter sp. PAMC25284 TaxID=2861279 RepID=UPI0021591E09|nr:hypothetical protein [Arthrobacter sp. PAMC25284]
MPTVPAPRVPRLRAMAGAAALSASVLLGTVLSGCEYEYDDGPWDDDFPAAAAPAATGAAIPPVLPQQAGLNQPLSGDELDDWVDDVLPDTDHDVLHTSSGSVDASDPRSETTTALPGGSYSVTLACRSADRVFFTVRGADMVLLDLSLRCGTSAVNIVFLPTEEVLTIQIAGQAPANYAYMVDRA